MLLHDKLKSYNIILASASPRRRELLRATSIEYSLAPKFECEELYPATLAAEDVAAYLSELKSRAYPTPLAINDILNNKSNDSSTHTSSSGRTHGGTGGTF